MAGQGLFHGVTESDRVDNLVFVSAVGTEIKFGRIGHNLDRVSFKQ